MTIEISDIHMKHLDKDILVSELRELLGKYCSDYTIKIDTDDKTESISVSSVDLWNL